MRIPRSLASLLLLLGLILPASAADDVRRDRIERDFAAHAGGQLVLRLDRGRIAVEGGDTDRIRIVMERNATRGSRSKAADLLRRHEVEFVEDGSTLRVESRLEGLSRWSWRRPQLEVSVQVQVPRQFNLNAHTAGGGIHIMNLEGGIALRTSGGSLRLESVGGTIQGKTSGGSIHVQNATGLIELNTSGGSIRVSDVSGKRLAAKTSGGSIHLSEINALVEASTSGGGIQLQNVISPLQATTSGGSIRGTLSKAPDGDISLRTSGGSISLHLPSNSSFQLDAVTSGGSVSSDFPVLIQGNSQGHRLKGPVGDGGPTVLLRTSGGGIKIHKS